MQTHLYRRGATYWWRRLVPTAFQPILGARDLRASLRTNLPETARSRARQMDAAFDLALEELEQIVRAGQLVPEAVKSRLVRELRQEIIEKAEDARLTAHVRTPEEIEAAVAKALRLQNAVRGLVSSNDLGRGQIEADRLLAREGIQLDRTSPEYRRFAKDVLAGMADAFGIISDNEQGIEYDPDGPRPVKIAISDQSDGIRTPEQVRQDNTNLRALFSTHAEAFVASKKASQRWGPEQIADNLTAFKLFKEFVGDKPVAHYTQADTTAFVNLLSRMPVGVNQRHPYIGVTATEAIRKADEIEARQLEQANERIKRERIKGAAADKLRLDARVKRLSVVSIIKYRDPCSSVFKYLQSILNVNFKNPFFGVRPEKPAKCDVRDEREKYSDVQVRRIFSSPIWTGCKSGHFFCIPGTRIIKNENYWVVVIAALMGMRLEEICQLWLEDIVDDEGIWCIDIWKGKERRLKNGRSSRRVPIPDILIKLGLLTHVEDLREKGEYRLFPTLERSTKIDPRTGLGKLGPAVTKSLGRYFRIHKLASLEQLLHAFRHTFASALDRKGVPMKAINDLVGHKQDGSESQRRYIKRDELMELKGYIDRVSYGLEFVEIDGEWHFAKADEGHPAAQ